VHREWDARDAIARTPAETARLKREDPLLYKLYEHNRQKELLERAQAEWLRKNPVPGPMHPFFDPDRSHWSPGLLPPGYHEWATRKGDQPLVPNFWSIYAFLGETDPLTRYLKFITEGLKPQLQKATQQWEEERRRIENQPSIHAFGYLDRPWVNSPSGQIGRGGDPCAILGLPFNKPVIVPDKVTVLEKDKAGRIVPKSYEVAGFGIVRLNRLRTDQGGGTTPRERAMVRKLGKQGDQAGHLIARQFWGPSTWESHNIFPQNPMENQRDEWYQGERSVARNVGERCTVCYVAFTMYGDPQYPARPLALVQLAWVNGVLEHNRSYENP